MRNIIIILIAIMLSGCSNEEVGKVVCKEFPQEIKQSVAIKDEIAKPQEVDKESEREDITNEEIVIIETEPTNEDSSVSEEPITEPTPSPEPKPGPKPQPESKPEPQPEPEPKPGDSIEIEAIEQDFEGEDGDFIADDGSLNYFYKKYESFEACQAAGDEILWDWDSDWGSYSCLGHSLYYTK